MAQQSLKQIHKLPRLPDRPADAHKGTFGKVLIVAGSTGMSGAACLAGLGALRGGAGLVRIAVPNAILPIVAACEPSYLTASLADDDHGRISAAAAKQIEALLAGQTSVAVGPGWGRSSELTELGHWLFQSVPLPMVVDADALNALAEARRPLSEHAGPRIVTPHPGEFARLLGISTDEVAARRENLAARFARENGLVVLLKGRRTVITDGQRIAVNKTGNSGMATGGTGDVLTGLVAALLAQRMETFEAAQLGAHLHGLAGDIAAKSLSQQGMIAGDVAACLPKAWQKVVE